MPLLKPPRKRPAASMTEPVEEPMTAARATRRSVRNPPAGKAPALSMHTPLRSSGTGVTSEVRNPALPDNRDSVMAKNEVNVSMSREELKALNFWPNRFLATVLSSTEYYDMVRAHGDVPCGQIVRLRRQGEDWSLLFPSMRNYRNVQRKLIAHEVLFSMSTVLTPEEFGGRVVEEVD